MTGGEKVKFGRPTKYKPEYAKQALKLCENHGATDLELADFFEVNVLTIHRWKIKHAAFCNAIKVGKDVADNRVEHSLYQKAMGYTYPSEKIFQSGGEIIRAETLEHVPPSDTAIIFWLKNRRKEDWRDKREVTGGDGEPLTIIERVIVKATDTDG